MIAESNLMTSHNDHVSEEPFYHHSYQQTADILDAIVTADKEKLHEALLRPADGAFGILSISSPIRSYKNLFISSVTEATDAVIQQGVDTESAYTLSDSFIQQLESLTTYDEITELFLTMFYGFIELMKRYNKTRYIRPVYLVMNYIKKHYMETIMLHQLATLTNFSEVHLSRLFKQQTGQTLSDYLIDTRIFYAKKLLTNSSFSIAKIALQTGFTDQSHLTRVFHSRVGMTPKQYRNSPTPSFDR